MRWCVTGPWTGLWANTWPLDHCCRRELTSDCRDRTWREEPSGKHNTSGSGSDDALQHVGSVSCSVEQPNAVFTPEEIKGLNVCTAFI